jgi:putative resolvase
MIKVGEAAKIVGRTVRTLQAWDRKGTFVAFRTATGRRYYTREQLDSWLGREREVVTPRVAVAYCRVSTKGQLPDLKNQRAAITQFCIARGLANVEYIEEVGGGLNFRRPKFLDLVDRIVARKVSCLVIAHRDRLTRFGVDLISHLCQQHGCELLEINDEQQSPEQEMVEDLMAVVHTFSCRLYGLRSYKKQIRKAAGGPDNSDNYEEVDSHE